jgi:hypothetical protein
MTRSTPISIATKRSTSRRSIYRRQGPRLAAYQSRTLIPTATSRRVERILAPHTFSLIPSRNYVGLPAAGVGVCGQRWSRRARQAEERLTARTDSDNLIGSVRVRPARRFRTNVRFCPCSSALARTRKALERVGEVILQEAMIGKKSDASA